MRNTYVRGKTGAWVSSSLYLVQFPGGIIRWLKRKQFDLFVVYRSPSGRPPRGGLSLIAPKHIRAKENTKRAHGVVQLNKYMYVPRISSCVLLIPRPQPSLSLLAPGRPDAAVL